MQHSTVKRVLSETGVTKDTILVQKSMIDPFLPFILDQLKRFPTLTATSLYGMVVERGYPGGEDYFRSLISFYRPKTPAEAYLRLRTLPGEQAQVDWGHFGYMTIGLAKRPLMAFVMVLSYSRKVFLHFFLNARTENFLRGHELAFNYFAGSPRVALYDNLKSGKEMLYVLIPRYWHLQPIIALNPDPALSIGAMKKGGWSELFAIYAIIFLRVACITAWMISINKHEPGVIQQHRTVLVQRTEVKQLEKLFRTSKHV